MEIAIGDSRRHGVASCRCREGNFCSFIHSYPRALEICKMSDIDHVLEMERCGDTVEYTCPFGIEEVLVPIKRGEESAGYIFCSMGILDGNGSMAENRVLECADGIDPSLLRHYVDLMPRLSPERMNAYVGIIKMIAEYIEKNNLMPDESESIGKLIKNYINDNLARKITLADIGWNLHCSTVTLTQHFKREFGITITDYITKKRMTAAEGMLRNTDMPISEISPACGFSDVEYFSRCFKKHHGIPPGEWRRSEERK